MAEKTQKCCLCEKPFVGYDNNPHPFKGDVCCDECNAQKVVIARLKQLYETREQEAEHP